MTFDSKMTFEKHLRSVSATASQRLNISRKFHDRSLLGRCFRGFVLPVLKYCSAVWCSTADTHLKLLDREVNHARFLTGGVFECDIAHRRSMPVRCILYKIRCKAMHPLNGALPGPRCIDQEVKPILRSDEEKELRVTSARGQRKLVVKNFSQTFVKNAFYFL